MQEYDVIVIGSGSGLIVLEAALKSGLKCALIENAKFGGTCLTRGCIPSKILTYPADVIMQMKHAARIGLDFELRELHWDTIARRMWQWINESETIESTLDKAENLTVYKGLGEFTSPYTMRVLLHDFRYTEEFRGERIVIAAGARSLIPPVEGLAASGYVSPESFFNDKFPAKPYKSLVIIGGGAIGAEFAHIFSAFGTKITIVEMKPRLLSAEEEEISVHLEKQFAGNGIEVLTNHQLTAAATGAAGKTVTLKNMATGEDKTIECEEIFLAAGLISNADRLQVARTGITTDARGWMITDEYLRTSVKNIWAIGDINGKYQFRHKANYEAEILAGNEFGNSKTPRAADYTKVPWAIYTCPPVAHVGLTEQQAKTPGKRLLIGKKHYSSVAKGSAMGYSPGDADDGFVKIIADENKKIIGVHIIGSQADLLVQAFVYLMNAGYTCGNPGSKECERIHKLNNAFDVKGSFAPIFQSMVIHPSLSEVAAWVLGEMRWSE